MAKKTISPLEQHVEKIVLGVSLLLLVGSAVYFLVVGAPYHIEAFSNESLTPVELGQKIRDEARALADRWRTLPAPQPAPTTDDTAPTVFSLLDQFKDIQPTVPAAQPWQPPLVEGERSSTGRRRALARIVAPINVQHAVHRNVLNMPEHRALADLPAYGFDALKDSGELWGSEAGGRYWVLVTGQVDLSAVEKAFRDADYPSELIDLVAHDVQLQRREVTRSRNGNLFGPWTDVAAWTPFDRPLPPRVNFDTDGSVTTVADRAAVESYISTFRGNQPWVLRPPHPKRDSGDTIRLPLIPYLFMEPKGFYNPNAAAPPIDPDIRTQVRAWLREAEKADTEGKLDLAVMYAESVYWAAGVDPRDRQRAEGILDSLDKKLEGQGRKLARGVLRRYMPIIAYDLSVEPGRDYQYRMRLRVLNQLVGRPRELLRPDDARRFLIEGAWSEPTPVFEVPSDLYVFLIRSAADRNEATVEVFRREGASRSTRYESKRYTVKPGDSIGRLEKRGRTQVDFITNLVVVDIDFDYVFRPPGGVGQPEPTTLLVCADENDPSALRERVMSVDLANEKYQELQSK